MSAFQSRCGSASAQVLCPTPHARCLDDLHAMLTEHGDWMPLGSADEQKPAAEGTVEACARSADNPVSGWYGLKKGMRGRFGGTLSVAPPP